MTRQIPEIKEEIELSEQIEKLIEHNEDQEMAEVQDSQAIEKYIDQRMAQKMDALKDDVRQMLLGLQVDLMR